MGTPEPDRLSDLLRQWPGIEPRPMFEQDVLRRIRLEAARSAAGGVRAWLPVWLGSSGRLVWGAGIPLLLALLLGILSARFLPAGADHGLGPYGGFSVLDRDTVAGSYIAMAEGR